MKKFRVLVTLASKWCCMAYLPDSSDSKYQIQLLTEKFWHENFWILYSIFDKHAKNIFLSDNTHLTSSSFLVMAFALYSIFWQSFFGIISGEDVPQYNIQSATDCKETINGNISNLDRTWHRQLKRIGAKMRSIVTREFSNSI